MSTLCIGKVHYKYNLLLYQTQSKFFLLIVQLIITFNDKYIDISRKLTSQIAITLQKEKLHLITDNTTFLDFFFLFPFFRF